MFFYLKKTLKKQNMKFLFLLTTYFIIVFVYFIIVKWF